MTDLFEWAAIQTNATLSGDCTDFGIVTNIEEFDISNCTIPVGSWTTTSCSMTCGNGTIYRNRTCNNPSPSDGGKICQGVDNESSVCNLGDCPVDGHWGLWSSVRCSVTCGNGIGIRTRRCDNPAPSGGGNGCVGCDKKKKLCSLGKCHNAEGCASNPCSNGASCTQQINGFMCKCAVGFTGIFCEAVVCLNREGEDTNEQSLTTNHKPQVTETLTIP
ncbi:THBS1 [Mytilus edulis]|uniref:THBS1 n=1 Tax=Mytilus edulis TaxID=6550 RepID=A0A8S3U5K3_MYTED|nr:THBS1 [Mytilus edulis]